MIRRPKPSENEDDILRMQEEFLTAKNIQPSAQVVNLRKTEYQPTKRPSATLTESRRPSKYAKSKGLLNENIQTSENASGSILGDIVEKNLETKALPELKDDNVYYPKVLPLVLGDIVEKSYDCQFNYDFKPMSLKGFPVVCKRDSYKITKRKEENMDIDHTLTTGSSSNTKPKALNIPQQSYILTNKDADVIHRENVEILNNMDEKEILAEQEKLFSTLDIKLIDFIKAKKPQANTANNPVNRDTKDALNEIIESNKVVNLTKNDKTAGRVLQINDSVWENDVLSHPFVNQWLHFENLEKEKLEWIKSIEYSKCAKPDEPYEARFDFKGYLLPYTIEYTEEAKTLFHHGEEPHRPGYSITELIELTRSTISQQRIMALNTIAGILEYSMAGVYKDVIEIPLSKLFFIIRIAMDENKVIILEPALKAMRNLLFNRIDEACLDALLGFEEGIIQPCLENDKSKIEEIDSKESELKDFHLAEIDLIAAVLRTDILQRLYYILETLRPSFNCVQYSLQIIIRLCRDSIEVANKIVQLEHLLNVIIKNFIPITSINFTFNPSIVFNGKPILAALKLIRILSLQSREIGEILITKHDILLPISEYINSGVDGTYGLRIQIEAFCILSNFLNYGLGTQNIMSLSPLVITTIYKHVQGTDIFFKSSVLSATHAAVVLQFIKNLLSHKNINLYALKQQVYPLLKEGVQKWIHQIAHSDSYTSGHLRLLCATLDCYKTVICTENVKLQHLNDNLKMLCLSKGFEIIVNNLVPSSNLLSGITDTDVHVTKNIVNIGGSIIDSTQKVVPILSIASPVPLFVSLFKLLNIVNDKELTNLFIQKILNYLQNLSKKPPSLINNWFTRMEVDFVFEIVKLSTQSDIFEPSKDLIYSVSSKLCYILRVDKKYELEYIFNNIIFNRQWFSAERLFNLISLNGEDGFLTSFCTIDNIRACYTRIINLNHIKLSSNIVLKKWQEPIIPRDWIYLPILILYSNSQNVKTDSILVNDVTRQAVEKEHVIVCSLEWILFNEITFPDLLNDIDGTDRFCRIMCVFLCDNSFFLDKNINILLRKCTKILFKKYGNKFNFDKELTGLYNFQDFYTQFLEQFQSVSYGDHTFAACVLVPLAQRHNVKWRKLLWSEYAGCLRALDCPEQCLCYGINDYLYPAETDESLLKSYVRALSSNLLRPGTVSYKIAQHHVEIFRSNKGVKNLNNS